MPGLPSIGPFELILVLAIALLILGPGKLPDVGSALGKTIREFRKAATDVEEAASLEARPTSTRAQTPSTGEAERTTIVEPSADGLPPERPVTYKPVEPNTLRQPVAPTTDPDSRP